MGERYFLGYLEESSGYWKDLCFSGAFEKATLEQYFLREGFMEYFSSLINVGGAGTIKPMGQ